MRRFRERLAAFMYGRNGPDSLYTFVLWVSAIILLISTILKAFVSLTIGYVLQGVAFILIIYAFFRAFSRNVEKRSAENERYHQIKFKIRAFFTRQKNRKKYKNTFIYIKCPSCKNVLRFKRVVGTHNAKCPCCKHTFEINIR